MSDTDEDMMPNNVFKLPPERSTIHLRRQNINNINKHYNSHNQMSTSSFASTNQYRDFNHRSVSSRRETSPMSLRSFPNIGMQFQQSYYRSAISSQGSIYNETHRSPMSVRSIDSSASLSAADIAFAFKNLKCNRSELQLIKKEYKMFMKNHARRRIQKRRNLKSFMRQFRRGPGGDSGDEGSDSSVSSDDCRSTRSAVYKENIPLPRFRPLRSNLRQTMYQFRENGLYQDCTEDLKQKSLTSIISLQNKIHNSTCSSHEIIQNVPNNKNVEQQQNSSILTLKDRFAKGPSFTLLPSERFSQSVAKQGSVNHQQEKSINNKNMTLSNCESDSECNEIFSQNISRPNKTQSNLSLHQKRIFESDTTYPLNKRIKTILSPKKHAGSITVSNNTESTDFNFMKPQIPIQKMSTVTNNKVPKILPKCSQTLDQDVSISNPVKNSTEIYNEMGKDVTFNKTIPQNNKQSVNDNDISELTLNSTDASMKNSFMKRKLFTQTLDVADNKNVSIDNLGINSPRERVVRSCREKNKVRKLVTSQSCLTRDVLADDNVIDLIHKIVPVHQMNITNKQGINKDNQDEGDKWDVTSALSVCNIDDASDTYTDEEIFNRTKKAKQRSNNKSGEKLATFTNNAIHNKQTKVDKVGLQTKVVHNKVPATSNGINKKSGLKEKECPNKASVSNCIKSFWDTDFESELEDVRDLPWKSRLQDNSIRNNLINSNNFIENKKGRLRNTKPIRNFRNNVINGSMRLDMNNISEKDTTDNYHIYKEQNNNETLSNSITSNLIDMEDETQMERSKSTKNNTKQGVKNSKNIHSTKETNERSKKLEKSKDQPKTTAKTKKAKNIESPQTMLNTSRQSKRLKEKREAKDKSNNLIQTSIIITKSPKIRSNKFNTSRESERLKQKRAIQTNATSPLKKGNKRIKQI